jgi:SAM-dependent methyltransferase
MGSGGPDLIRAKVRDAYSAIAARPADKHVFPVGRTLAEELGYPGSLLDSLPAAAVEAFAGVSNVSVFAELAQGSTVLDVGCGAGMDSLAAARRAGFVLGIDFSEVMLERAHLAAEASGARNVAFVLSDAEDLPLAPASIDVALVNGIFNLNPRRSLILTELARVLRPGGTLYGAELILENPLPEEAAASEANWFA